MSVDHQTAMHERLQPIVRRHVPLRMRNAMRRLPSVPGEFWSDFRRTSLIDDIRPYTMISQERLVSLADQVQICLRENIAGDFVECGTWRGGASFLMAKLLERAGERNRKVWMFDSFEGLPAPTTADGERAEQYASGDYDGDRYDNCSASIAEVRAGIARLGIKNAVPIKGWFSETLPEYGPQIGQIALLRLDGDWYDSINTCLAELYKFVSPGGFIVFDDYHDWDGCALAVHEFLANVRPTLRLHFDGQVYVRKTRASST
jgi:O-methyltransferase